DSLTDHAALELGKGASDLKHEPSGWGSRVDGLLIEIQIDTAGFQCLDSAQQVDKGAAKPVNSPSHRYRSVGDQTMRVGHVTISDGGQAIVGNVASGRTSSQKTEPSS